MVAKWSGFAVVLAPILFVLSFTIAGLLRPGYSPIHQAISDLGVGARPCLLNIPAEGPRIEQPGPWTGSRASRWQVTR